MTYFYQYNDDGSVGARGRSTNGVPDHPNQAESDIKHNMRHLGYDKDADEFFEIKTDIDGKRVLSNGKYVRK